MTRQPKLLSPCHRINKEALLALKTYKGGSLFAGQAGGPSSLCAIRAVRSRTKKQGRGLPRPCLVELMSRLFLFAPHGPTCA